MGPVSFTYSANVPAPIDRVFALISDPLRMPEWLPSCVAVKATTSDRMAGKGARYKLTFQRDTHQHESVIEIIDFSAPHTFGWVEIYHRAGSKTFFALGFEGGSTKVSLKHIEIGELGTGHAAGHLVDVEQVREHPIWRRRHRERIF